MPAAPQMGKGESRKREHQCPECKKVLTTSEGLNIHRRIHTGEKPYKCEICGHAFSRKWNYTCHVRGCQKRELQHNSPHKFHFVTRKGVECDKHPSEVKSLAECKFGLSPESFNETDLTIIKENPLAKALVTADGGFAYNDFQVTNTSIVSDVANLEGQETVNNNNNYLHVNVLPFSFRTDVKSETCDFKSTSSNNYANILANGEIQEKIKPCIAVARQHNLLESKPCRPEQVCSNSNLTNLTFSDTDTPTSVVGIINNSSTVVKEQKLTVENLDCTDPKQNFATDDNSILNGNYTTDKCYSPITHIIVLNNGKQVCSFEVDLRKESVDISTDTLQDNDKYDIHESAHNLDCDARLVKLVQLSDISKSDKIDEGVQIVNNEKGDWSEKKIENTDDSAEKIQNVIADSKKLSGGCSLFIDTSVETKLGEIEERKNLDIQLNGISINKIVVKENDLENAKSSDNCSEIVQSEHCVLKKQSCMTLRNRENKSFKRLHELRKELLSHSEDGSEDADKLKKIGHNNVTDIKELIEERHSKKEKKTKCDKESKEAKSKRNALKYKKTSLQRKQGFECNTCGKFLTTPYGLQNHLMVHEGQKPFVCRFCSHAFTKQWNLKTHLINRHKIDPTKKDLEPSVPLSFQTGLKRVGDSEKSESKEAFTSCNYDSVGVSSPESDFKCTWSSDELKSELSQNCENLINDVNFNVSEIANDAKRTEFLKSNLSEGEHDSLINKDLLRNDIENESFESSDDNIFDLNEEDFLEINQLDTDVDLETVVNKRQVGIDNCEENSNQSSIIANLTTECVSEMSTKEDKTNTVATGALAETNNETETKYTVPKGTLENCLTNENKVMNYQQFDGESGICHQNEMEFMHQPCVFGNKMEIIVNSKDTGDSTEVETRQMENKTDQWYDVCLEKKLPNEIANIESDEKMPDEIANIGSDDSTLRQSFIHSPACDNNVDSFEQREIQVVKKESAALMTESISCELFKEQNVLSNANEQQETNLRNLIESNKCLPFYSDTSKQESTREHYSFPNMSPQTAQPSSYPNHRHGVYLCSIAVDPHYPHYSNTDSKHQPAHPADGNDESLKEMCECQACGKMLASQNTLESHTRIHTGEKSYKCEICEKTFSLKSNCTQHVLTHSPGKQRKDFMKVSGFLDPISSQSQQFESSYKHDLVRPSSGMLPPMHTFMSGNPNQEHSPSMLPDHSQPYSQSSIPSATPGRHKSETFSLPENGSLNPYHNSMHEYPSQGHHPYFMNSTNYYTHDVACSPHTTSMQVMPSGRECVNVQQNILNESKLQMHHAASQSSNIQTSSHSILDNSESAVRQIAKQTKEYQGERKHPTRYCDICKKSFSANYYPNHMKMHTGTSPHVCTICNQSFSQKFSLTRHVYKIHQQKLGDAIIQLSSQLEPLPESSHNNGSSLTNQDVGDTVTNRVDPDKAYFNDSRIGQAKQIVQQGQTPQIYVLDASNAHSLPGQSSDDQFSKDSRRSGTSSIQSVQTSAASASASSVASHTNRTTVEVALEKNIVPFISQEMFSEIDYALAPETSLASESAQTVGNYGSHGSFHVTHGHNSQSEILMQQSAKSEVTLPQNIAHRPANATIHLETSNSSQSASPLLTSQFNYHSQFGIDRNPPTSISSSPIGSPITSSKSKSINCPMCNKELAHSNSLPTHMRVHTGEKPFSCELCSKTFAQSSNLNKHRKSCRKKVDRKEDSMPPLKASVETFTKSIPAHASMKSSTSSDVSSAMDLTLSHESHPPSQQHPILHNFSELDYDRTAMSLQLSNPHRVPQGHPLDYCNFSKVYEHYPPHNFQKGVLQEPLSSSQDKGPCSGNTLPNFSSVFSNLSDISNHNLTFQTQHLLENYKVLTNDANSQGVHSEMSEIPQDMVMKKEDITAEIEQCLTSERHIQPRSECVQRPSSHVILKDHIAACTCTVCNKVLSCMTSLRRHMQIHTCEKTYSCQLCDKQFSRKYNTHTHIKSCVKQMVCKGHLPEDFLNRNEQELYKLFTNEGNAKIDMENNLHEMMQSGTDVENKSDNTCDTVKEESSQSNKIEKKHVEGDVNKDINLIEEVLLERMGKRIELENEAFSSEEMASRSQSPNVDMVDQDCSEQSVDSTETSETGNLNVKNIVYECGYRTRICTDCGLEITGNPSLMIQHIRTHTKEKPFLPICDFCCRPFSSKFSLNRHINSQHGENRHSSSGRNIKRQLGTYDGILEECNDIKRAKMGAEGSDIDSAKCAGDVSVVLKSSLYEDANVLHFTKTATVKTENSGEVVNCVELGLSGDSQTLVQEETEHLQNDLSHQVTENKLENVERVIDKSFVNTEIANRNKSKRSFAVLEESTVEAMEIIKHGLKRCDLCNKEFSRPSLLQNHMRLHTGAEKPFKCIMCRKTFSYKCNLKTHLEKHKSEMYMCNICEELFVTETELAQHSFKHSWDDCPDINTV